MNQQIKIAFFDIDGTLIDIHTKKMRDKTKEALLGLQKNGIKICIATGRPPFSLPQFDGITFDAFLTFNGSYCFNKEDVMFNQPIPTSNVKQILSNAENLNRPVVIAGLHRMGANGSDQDLIDYFAIAKQKVTIIDDFDALAEEDIYQIMLSCHKNEHEAILNCADEAKITSWWSRAADVIPRHGGKGMGVQSILTYYQINKEEAIAFGDGANDIEMLQAVGLGVAMGNADDHVKSCADDVCKDASEDGIYYYCKEKGFI